MAQNNCPNTRIFFPKKPEEIEFMVLSDYFMVISENSGELFLKNVTGSLVAGQGRSRMVSLGIRASQVYYLREELVTWLAHQLAC